METPTIAELRAATDAAATQGERLSTTLNLVKGLFQSDSPAALELAAGAIELAESMNDHRGVAEALRWIGRIHIHGGDYHRALEYLQRASLRYESIGDRLGVAHTTNLIGLAHLQLSEYQTSLERLAAAHALFEELGDHVNDARVIGNMGLAYNRLGEYAKALEMHQLNFRAAEEAGERGFLAQPSVNIGLVYKGLGDYSKALEHLQLASRLHEEFGDRLGVARAMSSIGTVHGALGEHATALEYLQSALRIHEEYGHRLGVANATSNIGKIFTELGEHEKALAQFESARESFRDLGDREGMANVTGNVGDVLLALGNHAEALTEYRTALALFEELGVRHGVAVVTSDIGSVYARKEFHGYDPARAEQLLLQAVEVAADIGSKLTLHTTHQKLTALYIELGRWKDAFEHQARSHQLKDELHAIEAHTKVQQIQHLRQISEMENRRALELAEEQAQRETLGLRMQLLEVQLDRQRTELAAQAMHLAKQTEMLGGFRNDLRAIMRVGSDPLTTVKQIKEKLKELPCDAIDWTKFDAEFRQSYPEFQSRLIARCSELSGMELKVCALLKLKLTSTDIAKLLCLSERSVEGHRLRIRRKLGLSQGEDIRVVLAGI